MEIEREIGDVLHKHGVVCNFVDSCKGLGYDFLVSNLARLVKREEPSREELIRLLNRIGLSNSGGNIASGPYTAGGWNKLIDALMSWATTGGARKRVTREELATVLTRKGVGRWYKVQHKQDEDCSWEGLLDAIMRLLDPEPSKRWCEHITFDLADKEFRYHQGIMSLSVEGWLTCPICGVSAPRPS